MRSKIEICKKIARFLLKGITVFIYSVGFLSCGEFLQVPVPDTELVRDNVFTDDATATAAIINIYSQLSNGASSFANGRLSICEGAYADELVSHAASNSTSSVAAFYFNNIVSSNDFVSSTWGTCYNIIYSANLIIEGLSQSTSVSSPVRNQVLGEAYFMRAFCHFYLVNLYGNVPLITTSDYRLNAKVHRTPVELVYTTIISDLLEAKALLSDTYPSAGRVRVNKGAAIALVARAYLYRQEFEKAETESSEVINKSLQYKLEDLNNVFLKTSQEAIWQLLPNGGQETYTYEGLTFILVAPPTNVSLRSDLVASFEPGDLRKEHWIDSLVSASGFTTWYYPFKYKENYQNATNTENSMVLRLAEQYLIRAEARAKQGKLIGMNSAQSDINIIRTRAGLANTTATTQSGLLMAIEHERRVELFTEWGHRFFDLRRTDRINEVVGSIKPNWNDNNKLLPIPQSEILLNPNLEPQNPGY